MIEVSTTAAEQITEECYTEFPFSNLAISKLKYQCPFMNSKPVTLHNVPVVPGRVRKSTHILTDVVSMSLDDVSISEEEEQTNDHQLTTIENVRTNVINYKVDKMLNDPYDEEITEIKYLRSKPTCFMVLGKPSMDGLKLAKLLASYWGCVCIDPESSLEIELHGTSRAEVWCHERLMKGLTIPSNIVMRLMERQVLTNKVQHCGYVLYGLPFQPGDNDVSVSVQMDMIYSWPLRPNVYIYVTCPDYDVSHKNSSLLYDYTTGHYVNRNMFKMDKEVHLVYSREKKEVVSEESINELMNEVKMEKSLILESASRHLVHIPRVGLLRSLVMYQRTILPYLEEVMSKLDPQYVIKVDGRTTPMQMLKVIKARLELLPLMRVCIPVMIRDQPPKEPFKMESDGEDTDDDEDMALIGKAAKEAFVKLCKMNIPGPRHKWHISQWKHYCPVAVATGSISEGKAENAVRFLDKIYLLSSADAISKFLVNPRSYLMPPNPQPACKFFIMGPNHAGKTAVSQYLADTYKGKVIPVQALLKQHQKVHLNLAAKDAAIEEAKQLLEQQRQAAWENAKKEREAEIEAWCKRQEYALKKIVPDHTNSLSGLSVGGYDYTGVENVIAQLSEEERQEIRENPEIIRMYLPPHLVTPMPPPSPVIGDESFIQQYVKEALKQYEEPSLLLVPKDIAAILAEAIRDAQAERIVSTHGDQTEGGWVLDGMLPVKAVWEILYSFNMIPEYVICVRDHNPEYSFLASKWTSFHMMKPEEFYLQYPGYGSSPSLMDVTSIDSEVTFDEITATSVQELGTPENIISDLKKAQDEKLERYLQNVAQFDADFSEFLQEFVLDPAPLDIDIDNKMINAVIEEVITFIEARFHYEAVPFTNEDREEEMVELAKEIEESDEVGETDEEKHPSRFMGDAGRYCPVVYHNNYVLWQGKEELLARYRDKMYTFSSEEAMETFKSTPWKFAPHRVSVDYLPPLRICVIGPIGSGKTTIGARLASMFGVIHKDFQDDVDNILTPAGVKPIGRRNEDSFGFPSLPKESELGGEETYKPEEIRTTLIQYLKEGMPVPETLVPNVLQPLWNSEPYRTTGFIYSGFPLHPQDIDTMKRHCLIPDVIVQLSVDNYEVVEKRVLKEFMDLWKKRQDTEKRKARESDTRVKEEWKKQRDARKKELFIKHGLLQPEGLVPGEQEEEKEGGKESVIEDDKVEEEQAKEGMVEVDKEKEGGAEVDKEKEEKTKGEEEKVQEEKEEKGLDDTQQIEMEIEELLQNEFPEFEFPYRDWEHKIDAEERLTQEIMGWCEADNESLETLKTLAGEENIPWVQVKATKKVEDICLEIIYKVIKYKTRSASLFETTYPLGMEEAEKLLQCGYLFLSKFGRWCPVQIFKNEIPVHMYRPLLIQNQVFPIQHRRYVYFLAGQANKEEFMKDPMRYVNQDKPHALVPVQVAIIGPPKSGKSQLSNRIAKMLGLKVITAGQSIRYVLENLGWTELATTIEEQLREGETISIQLIVRCIEAATSDQRSVTQGFVLDGFPNTIRQMQELATVRLIPYLIIALECTFQCCTEYLKSDIETRTAPSYPLLLLEFKHSEWQTASELTLEFVKNKYHNLYTLSSETGRWWLYENAMKLIYSVMSSIYIYFRDTAKEKAVRLNRMCVTGKEFIHRQGQYRGYCPVCLKLDRHYKSGDPSTPEGMVQYMYDYYWVCENHLPLFLNTPRAFIPPINQVKLPEFIPERALVSLRAMEEVENYGYCIVTYCENLPRRYLVKGLPEYGVLYRDKNYVFANEECQEQFMKEPEAFCHREICIITPALPPLQVATLPCMGFLEQTTCHLIHKAVTVVGAERPKYPGLNAQISAAIYLGYLLKMLNPNISADETHMYDKARERYINCCHMFKRVLRSTRKRNPFQVLNEHEEEIET